MSSSKVDAATGLVTVAVAGISATFSHEDFEAWGGSFMSLAPLILILFLIWRIWKLDQQHKDCQDNYAQLQKSQEKMQEQIVYAYLAVKSTNTSNREIATIRQFAQNELPIPPSVKEVIKEQ